MKMKSLYFTIFCILFSSNLVAATNVTCNFPAIFNFGDSNSDTGGFSAMFGQAGPPHGLSFFGHPAGRYCDGRLVVDFIAENLGFPYLSGILDSVGTNFSYGANFATAGSPIRPQNTTVHQSGFSPISINVQFYEFNDFQKRSQVIRSRGGVFETLLPKAEHFSNALYTFDIGQNDLVAGYFANLTTEQVRASLPDILGQYKNILKNVYGSGGRYFWIHNTGPFGCLPYVLDRVLIKAADVDRAGCAASLNKVAQEFNQGLKEVVDQLRVELPQVVITYVDIYSLKYSLFTHAKKYGFNEALRACCGHGGKYNYNKNIGCGGKIKVHGKEVLVAGACKDPSRSVIWDGVHFTQAANKYIFDHMVNGDFSDSGVSLKMACNK